LPAGIETPQYRLMNCRGQNDRQTDHAEVADVLCDCMLSHFRGPLFVYNAAAWMTANAAPCIKEYGFRHASASALRVRLV
jgi:hypothetical protein